jgi:hypothetical protein
VSEGDLNRLDVSRLPAAFDESAVQRQVDLRLAPVSSRSDQGGAATGQRMILLVPRPGGRTNGLSGSRRGSVRSRSLPAVIVTIAPWVSPRATQVGDRDGGYSQPSCPHQQPRRRSAGGPRVRLPHRGLTHSTADESASNRRLRRSCFVAVWPNPVVAVAEEFTSRRMPTPACRVSRAGAGTP